MKHLFSILILASIGYSCKRKCTFTCTKEDMGLLSQGFNESELDTVEMRAYFKNGNFNDLHNKTFKYNCINGLGRIERHLDWVIYFPATQQSYSISAITDEDKETIEADCKTTRGCFNAVASFKLNGQVVNAPNATLTK